METTPKPGPSMSMKVGAALIIAIMLFSGAAVFFASQSNNSDTTDPNTQNPTLTTYLAEEVTGKVTQVFPSVIVGGNTTSGDKSVIDEELAKLPGVTKLESQFTQLDSGSSQLTYLANIELSSLDDKESFLDALSTVTTISNPEVYFQASVQVPATLTGKSQANETKTFTLPQTTIQAIVSTQTSVNNDISGTVSVTYSGDQLASAYMVEAQNVSLTPTPVSLSGTYALSGLQNRYSIAGTLSYVPDLNGDVLQKEIGMISGVSSVDEPIIPFIDNTLVLTFTDANSFVDDVNDYIQLHADEYQSVSGYNNTLSVDLGHVTLVQAKTALASAIDNAASTNVEIEFQDPVTQFLIDVNVSATNPAPTTAALKDYFTNLGASVDIYQNGSVALAEIVAPDTNTTYAVPDGAMPVVVTPGHSIGDMILIQISAIALSGELSYINGVEVTPADVNSSA